MSASALPSGLCLPDFTLLSGHLCFGQHPCGPQQPVPPLLPGDILLVAAVAGVDEVAPLGDALDEGGQGEEALQHRVEVARVPCERITGRILVAIGMFRGFEAVSLARDC